MRTLLALFLLLSLQACNILNPGTNGQPPTTQQTVDNLKFDAELAITGYIAASDNAGAAAGRVYAAASLAKSLATSGADISNLQALADQIAASQLKGKDRDRAIAFTNITFALVRRYVGAGNVVPPDKLQDARNLIIELSQSAMDAAKPFMTSQGLPLP